MDYATLSFTDALVNLVCGLMNLTIWLNQRQDRCLMYWGVGLLIYAAVAFSFPFDAPDPVLLSAGYSLLDVGVVVIWLGFLSFDKEGSWPWWLPLLPLCPISSCLSVGAITGNWTVAGYATLVAHCAIAIGQASFILRRADRFGPRAIAAYAVYAVAFSAIISLLLRQHFAEPQTAETLTLVLDQALTMVFAVSVIAMVGERNFRELVRVARFDPLTGALNRAGLAEATLRRHHDSALLLFDLDHFKAINDTFGHDGGDAVLQQFTSRAQDLIDEDMLIARLGGEEFLVVSSDATVEGGKSLAEKICLAARREPVRVGTLDIPFTVSVGVALRRGDEDLHRALRRADEALYRAKADGRDRVVAANDMDCPGSPDTADRLQMRRKNRS